MSIRNKTINGLKWSFTDNAVNQIIHFAVGIILARLLSPAEFGIIGMITIFIAISESIVNSGLSSALIRKQDCTEKDFNTMFYTNIGFGLIMFAVLFVSASAISTFYSRPELRLLVKVMALNLVINSFGLVETAILTKQIDFKKQTKISLIASISSGVVGIILAYLGFGFWSLAIKTLVQNAIRVTLLHLLSSWRPKIQYSIDSFKDLFGFGVKIMASGLINTTYRNVYKLIIGKYFSAATLGFYSRAEQFAKLPSSNLELTTQKVTYPVLASLASDNEKLKAGYKKLIKLSFYMTCTLMMALMTTSREIVLILVGEKWAPSIPFLQIMCISAVLYPLHSLNLNMLNVKNRSDLFLKLEIIKKILVVPVILIGIRYGMIVMLWGMVFNSVLAYFLNSMWSAKLVGYSVIEQLKDILPTILFTSAMVTLVITAGQIVPDHQLISLAVKAAVIVGFIVVTGKMFKRPEYKEVVAIIKEQLLQVKKTMKARLSHT